MFTLDALRDAIAPRLAAARVKTDPFSHVWVDDIWPADVYARLEAAWPGDHLFYADKKGRKWNLAATAVPPSQKRGDFAAVPADHQALWCSRLSTFMPTTFLSREARRVAFRPNRLVAFANRLDAAHGVLAPADATRRKVLQFYLAFKDGPAVEPEY